MVDDLSSLHDLTLRKTPTHGMSGSESALEAAGPVSPALDSRHSLLKSQSEAARRRSLKVPRDGVMISVTSVFDIYKQVRTIVSMVSNVWGWSMATTTAFRQVLPGLLRLHAGTAANENFVIPGFYLQELDLVSNCVEANSGDMIRNTPISSSTIVDMTLKHPSRYFSHIKLLLKLRWLLRVHSACCELDYKVCSLRNFVLGIQYVILQQCSEVVSDNIFETKVSQHVGAHVNVESVIDDFTDQLQRALGGAFRSFLEFVATCDPLRCVNHSQTEHLTTETPVVANDSLVVAVDTIFLVNFLRISRKEKASRLPELYAEIELLGLTLPQVPPLQSAQHLQTWARNQTRGSRADRERARQPDFIKLAQLDAALLTAAVELHLPEIEASPEEMHQIIADVPVPTAYPPSDTVLESVNFNSSGRMPGSSGPPAVRVIRKEKPQLSQDLFEAAVMCIHAHMTFPAGIRERLYGLLVEEYGLTEDQLQRLAIAITQNIDGKRLSQAELRQIEHKEKTRLKAYFVTTGRKIDHLLAPSLVQSPLQEGKPPKYTFSPEPLTKRPFHSTLRHTDMTRSLPDFKSLDRREPFKVPMITGPLTIDPDLHKLRTTGFFIRMPPLKGQS